MSNFFWSYQDLGIPPMANSKLGCHYNQQAAVDSRGFVVGWHLPDDTEWLDLFTELGGVGVASGHMKEAGLTFWNTPNTGADNSSGFTSRAAGSRSGINGTFASILNLAFFWSATEVSGQGKGWTNVYNSAGISSGLRDKTFGHTVRLIKDDSTDPGYVDIDGKRYLTVTIGTQVWMAENLRAKNYANGDPIGEEQDNTAWAAATVGRWCIYGNDPDNE